MCSDWNIIDIVDEKHLKHAFEVANMDENEIKEQDDTSDTESDSGLDSDNKNSKIPEIIAEPNNLTKAISDNRVIQERRSNLAARMKEGIEDFSRKV